MEPDDWSHPSESLAVQRFRLQDDCPQILEVPPGFAAASMALTEGAILLVFSSGQIETAREDDIRYPTEQWKLVDSSGVKPN